MSLPHQAPARIIAADIQYVPGFLSEAEVDDLLGLREALPAEAAGVVGLPDDPGAVIRRAVIRRVSLADFPLLRQRLTATIAGLNDGGWGLALTGLSPGAELAEYGLAEEGPAFYASHLDLVDARCAPLFRKLSFVIGLSDAHAGGELAILNGPVAYALKVLPGDLVVFPSYLPQEVRPVTRGVRVTLDGWWDGPALR